MDAAARRAAILSRLEQADHPVSAAALAREFAVSRQIIVGDVALLRAGGADIAATPRGYLLPRPTPGLTRQLACVHRPEDMGRELELMVDNGCTVLDVVVEHPVYGQLVGQLQLSSRYDVEQFLNRSRSGAARPLSDLTGGIHLHTIRATDEKTLERVIQGLKDKGFLLLEDN